MRLVDLIRKFKVEDIEKRIIELYPSEKDAVSEGLYVNVIKNLLEKEPSESSLSIFLEKIVEDDDCYISVSGLSEDNDIDGKQKYAIEFCDWSEWLAMEIEESTIKEYSELDIVVHCLNKMTFLGYGEDAVTLEDLKKALDEYM